MSSYHTSFNFLNKNSFDEGFIVAAFEPDNGFTDAFLGMDQVSEDYFDGTKKFLYGTRYNTTATISISLIKVDGSDFTIADNRRALRWLTGARTASWLDLYNGEQFQYSFLGTITSPQQYKIDGRVVGISVEFVSITPWAFSAPQMFDCSIWQLLEVTEDGVLYRGDQTVPLGVHDGILSVSNVDAGSYFNTTDDGIVYMDNMYRTMIDNQSDDIYTYIYLDIDYQNENGTYVSIKNNTLNEEALVTDISPNESIKISAKQFIISDIPNKVFGDTFNFVWPRLQPGINDFVVDGNGRGAAKFTYRYPMKVGDCAMDISTYGGGTGCDDGASIHTYNTVRWEDIVGIPTSLTEYGIKDVYTKSEVDRAILNKADKATTLSGYGIMDAYTKDETYNKEEVYSKDMVYTKDDLYTRIEVDNKIDSKANKATTLAGYGITDAYTKSDVYNKDEVYTKDETYNNTEVYSKDMVYTKDEVYNKNETYNKEEVYSSDMVYTKDEVYSKSDVYNKNETYTKSEVDDKIDDIEISGGSGSVTIDEEKLNQMLNDVLG